jgi:hypothetical protein
MFLMVEVVEIVDDVEIVETLFSTPLNVSHG